MCMGHPSSGCEVLFVSYRTRSYWLKDMHGMNQSHTNMHGNWEMPSVLYILFHPCYQGGTFCTVFMSPSSLNSAHTLSCHTLA